MFRKVYFYLAAVAASLIAIGCVTVTPALASSGPYDVVATATVMTSIQVTGVSSSIAFGSVVPAVPATVTGAEAYTVITNAKNGVSISIVGTNSPSAHGFDDTHGNPTGINYSAITFHTTAGVVPLVNDGVSGTLLENAPAGQNSYSDDATLTIPPSATYVGGIHTDLTMTAVAN